MIGEAMGALGDIKGVVATGVRAVRTRLELIALEVKEEKAWTVRFILVTLVALYLLTFGLLMALLAVVFFAPEANRPAILAGGACAFVLGGAAAGAWVYAQSRRRQPLFEETISVLKGDEQGLQELMRGTSD